MRWPGPLPAGGSCRRPCACACTPLYASPEQERGEDPDPRDDVYALGVIWYQMLTGKLVERPGADWREELAGSRLSVEGMDLLGAVWRFARSGAWRMPANWRTNWPSCWIGPPAGRRRQASPSWWSCPNRKSQTRRATIPSRWRRRCRTHCAGLSRPVARAANLVAQQHDYAGAVKLLEALPEGFRDTGVLDVFRQRRDRVDLLRKEITAAARGLALRRTARPHRGTARTDPRRRGDAPIAQGGALGAGPEVVNAAGMKLLLIQPGVFEMGSGAGEMGRQPYEAPVHKVEISQRFYLGACPVTQEQYARVMGVNPSHFRKVGGCDTRLFPVENVSWDDAVTFCRKLSETPAERQRGRIYRLPTEAEWEYACRAGGDGLPFHCGRSLVSAQANFDGRHPYGGCGRGDFLQRTCAVGSYPANAWGLSDMHGNVWEWCLDWYRREILSGQSAAKPDGAGAGEARVLRGGSWQNHGRLCRSACRDWVSPGYRGVNTGFRVVLVVSTEED